MDEIDAALDFRNVSIVANYIKDRTKNAQFIIISLRFVGPLFNAARILNHFWFRNDMFELSHRLIGIYKTSNATRSTFAKIAAPPERKANTTFQVYQLITTPCSLLFPNTHLPNLRFRRHRFRMHKLHCQQLELFLLFRFCIIAVLFCKLRKLPRPSCIPMN